MLSKQKLDKCSDFSQELKLKQLAKSDRVSIIYIHGTARSGSTIAEIILTQLADVAIHQPFRGTLQKKGGRFRSHKLDFDADIYDSGCGLIVEQIGRCLQERNKVTVVIKELAGFFKPYTWQRWLEIPDKFLFTIREPHLQYMSWLSAMTDQVFQGKGKLQEDKSFVINQAEITENAPLTAEWEGTTISCNQSAWNALVNDFEKVKQAVINSDKKIAVLDAVLLRYKPEIALKNVLSKLELDKQITTDNLSPDNTKVWDIRDKTRPMVRKANHSQSIAPLTKTEAVTLDMFPAKSQEHIKQTIPLYLKLLAAKEQAYLPTLAELETTELIVIQPIVTYAIALLNLKNIELANYWFKSLAERKNIHTYSLQESFAVINNYWENHQNNHG